MDANFYSVNCLSHFHITLEAHWSLELICQCELERSFSENITSKATAQTASLRHWSIHSVFFFLNFTLIYLLKCARGSFNTWFKERPVFVFHWLVINLIIDFLRGINKIFPYWFFGFMLQIEDSVLASLLVFYDFYHTFVLHT